MIHCLANRLSGYFAHRHQQNACYQTTKLSEFLFGSAVNVEYLKILVTVITHMIILIYLNLS